jgi:hypothetical protein
MLAEDHETDVGPLRMRDRKRVDQQTLTLHRIDRGDIDEDRTIRRKSKFLPQREVALRFECTGSGSSKGIALPESQPFGTTIMRSALRRRFTSANIATLADTPVKSGLARRKALCAGTQVDALPCPAIRTDRCAAATPA